MTFGRDKLDKIQAGLTLTQQLVVLAATRDSIETGAGVDDLLNYLQKITKVAQFTDSSIAVEQVKSFFDELYALPPHDTPSERGDRDDQALDTSASEEPQPSTTQSLKRSEMEEEGKKRGRGRPATRKRDAPGTEMPSSGTPISSESSPAKTESFPVKTESSPVKRPRRAAARR